MSSGWIDAHEEARFDVRQLGLWLLAHKKQFGFGFLGVLAYIQMNPSMLEHSPMWLRHGLAMVGVFLTASGLFKSDQFYKDKIEVEKQQQALKG